MDENMNLENENLLDDSAEDNIVHLTDDEGNEVAFEYLATIPYGEKEYVVLMFIPEEDEEPENDEGDILVLEISTDEEGNEVYVTLEDEELAQTILDLYLQDLDNEDE